MRYSTFNTKDKDQNYDQQRLDKIRYIPGKLDQNWPKWPQKGTVQMLHVAPIVSTGKVFGQKSKVRPFLEMAYLAHLAG